MITVLIMLSICSILLVICYLAKFFLFSVCYYQIGEIKLYIYYPTGARPLTSVAIANQARRIPSVGFVHVMLYAKKE